jgi:undecaprenol kinase
MSSTQSPDNVIILNAKAQPVIDNVVSLPVAPDSVRNPFKAKHFIASLGFAWEGLQYITRAERNFRIHLAMASFAMLLGSLTGLATWEWLSLVMVCGLVLFAEAANTAIELVVDMITHGEFDARAKAVKDVAAGACLMCSILAVIVGGLVFIPHWFF